MAIKNIIAQGIGFTPGSVKWIPTHGFGTGAAVADVSRMLRAARGLTADTFFAAGKMVLVGGRRRTGG